MAAELAGPGDAVMKTLEEHLDCEVFLRGNVLTLDGDEDAVMMARTVVREMTDLVRELDLDPQGVSISFTAALTRFPSARPFTCGITRLITLPISCGEDAPDSATASPTISRSSSSDTC